MKKTILASLPVLLFAASMTAAGMDGIEKDDKAETGAPRVRHEVTVTAAPVLKEVKDCSTSVSVMDETDILAVRPLNALGALTHLPGIFAHRTGDFGRTDIEIRGLGQRGQRLAVLVDGRPEKMGIFGCAVTHAYPLDNVERIEVVRGPSSVLYGPDAAGGVVNILTRKPTEGFGTDLTAAYGGYRTMSLNLRHGAKTGKADYFFTADRLTSDGHVPHSSYRGSSFTGRLGYELGSGLSLRLQAKYFDGHKNEPGPVHHPSLVSWNDYRRGSVSFQMNGNWDPADLSLILYNDFGDHEFSDGWNSRDHYNGAIARMTVKLSPSHNLSCGVDARFLGGRSYNSPRGSWNKSDVGVYAYDEFVLGRRWILSAGLRGDKDSQFGWEATPQAGIVFRAGASTSLRVSVSKAYRSPHINELYLFPASNPDLEPERFWNHEIGIDQAVSDTVSVSAAFFRMTGSNLIEQAPNPAGFPRYRFLNTGAFTFNGVEVGLSVSPFRSMTGKISYSYLDAGDLTKGRPGQKIDADVRWRSGRFQAFFNAQHVSRYYAQNKKALRIPSYVLANARFEFSVTRRIGVFADINNVFAEDYLIYADLSGQAAGLYQMPGRNLHFGFRTRF